MTDVENSPTAKNRGFRTDTKYKKGDKVILPGQGMLLGANSAFVGWSIDKNASTILIPEDTYEITGNVTFYAIWKRITFTVKFVTNGGSSVDDQFVTSGNKLQVPVDPTKVGHVFSGWYTSSTLSTEFDETTSIISSQTLYAKWTPVFTVTYHANDGKGSVPVDKNEYKNSDVIQVLNNGTLEREYYIFAGWNTQADTLGQNYLAGADFKMGSMNVNLYAKWQRRAPEITSQPDSLIRYPLESASFTVNARGLDVQYQWYKDGNPIYVGSSTNQTYVIPDLSFSDDGQYWCVVSNAGGSVPSNHVRLTVRTTVTDIDGNGYNIVVLGTQMWTVENLRTTRFNNGTAIPHVPDSIAWSDLNEESAYCFYQNFTSSVDRVLYFEKVLDKLHNSRLSTGIS